MADFYTDLARHLAEYERQAAIGEAVDEWVDAHPDRPDLDLEERTLIRESDVIDARPHTERKTA